MRDLVRAAHLDSMVRQPHHSVKECDRGTPVTPTDVLPTTLTVAQAAKILGIHERTAYRAVRNGSIPSYRVSERRIVVPRELCSRSSPARTV